MVPGRQQTSEGLGRAFLWLAAIGMLGGLTLLFQGAQRSSGGLVHSSTDSGRAMVVLQRDRSGHYITQGQINGTTVNFLVDTGATDVAIPEQIARQLGLQFGPQVAVMTAAGPVRAWRTRLDRVAVGSVSLDNVRATITRAPMDEILLGMSFLQHFTLMQQGDELIIESGGASG